MEGIDTIRITLPAYIPPIIKGKLGTDFVPPKGYRFHEGIRFSWNTVCSFITGSLSNLLPGQEPKDQIACLADLLEFNPKEARLKRLDLAIDIQTDHIPEAYFPLLLAHPTLPRWYRSHGVYFGWEHNTRQLVFYNKAHQTKQPGNLLRNETRFNDLKGYRLIDLIEPSVLAGFWGVARKEYEHLHKQKFIIPMTSKKIVDQKTLIGIQTTGLDASFNELKAMRKAGIIAKHTEKYARATYRRIINDPDLSRPNPLIEELDKKILGR